MWWRERNLSEKMFLSLPKKFGCIESPFGEWGLCGNTLKTYGMYAGTGIPAPAFSFRMPEKTADAAEAENPPPRASRQGPSPGRACRAAAFGSMRGLLGRKYGRGPAVRGRR